MLSKCLESRVYDHCPVLLADWPWSPSHGKWEAQTILDRLKHIFAHMLGFFPGTFLWGQGALRWWSNHSMASLSIVDGICGDENANKERIMWSASKNVKAWMGINTHGETTSSKSGIIRMQCKWVKGPSILWQMLAFAVNAAWPSWSSECFHLYSLP